MTFELIKMILSLINLVAQIIVLISVIQLTVCGREEDEKAVVASCPRCGTGQVIGYSFIRPRKGKCPHCGANVTYKRV